MGNDTTAELETGVLLRGWAAVAPRQPERWAEIVWAARTDIGRVRENNEDKFDFFLPDDPTQLALRGRLWAVADGMGGHNAGQIASEAALKTLVRAYYDPSASENVEEALQSALSDANALIHHAALQFENKSNMGTTVVCVVVKDGTLTVAHIGDSRAYLLRGDEPIKQITTDHSWVEEQVRRGAMTRAEAESSPYRNYIMRSVGVEPAVTADVTSLPLQPGDRILLCSDGLTGQVKDDDLASLLRDNGPSQAALSLIDAANDSGGRDNITALILQVKSVGPYAAEESSSVAGGKES